MANFKRPSIPSYEYNADLREVEKQMKELYIGCRAKIRLEDEDRKRYQSDAYKLTPYQSLIAEEGVIGIITNVSFTSYRNSDFKVQYTISYSKGSIKSIPTFDNQIVIEE